MVRSRYKFPQRTKNVSTVNARFMARQCSLGSSMCSEPIERARLLSKLPEYLGGIAVGILYITVTLR